MALSRKQERISRILDIASRMADREDEKNGHYQVSNRIAAIGLYFCYPKDHCPDGWMGGYAEPGYENPESGVIAVLNWNDVHMGGQLISRLPSRLEKLFSKLGVPCEWSDEWADCSECCRLVRTEPDSFSWKPSYIELSFGGILCRACAAESSANEYPEGSGG